MNNRVTCEKGAIVCRTNWQTVCEYDVGNKRAMAQFDGRGRIIKASAANWANALELGLHCNSFEIDGQPLNECGDKTVTMLGREQLVTYSTDGVVIKQTSFLNEADAAIFLTQSWDNQLTRDCSIRLNFGFVPDITGKVVRSWQLHYQDGLVVGANVNYADGGFYVVFSHPVELIEQLENKLYFSFQQQLVAGAVAQFKLVMSFGNVTSYAVTEQLLTDFDNERQNSSKYSKWLSEIYQGDDEHERALVVSCINCAISSYKELPEVKFYGFFAGINYQKPARTYYRDGFWTVLPLLKLKPEWVRNEIITLAHGIAVDGECPSAVIATDDYKPWWSKHWDSPAFFALMLDEYISSSGDTGLLDVIVRDVGGNDRSVRATLCSCVDWLRAHCDDSGLLCKPRGNRLDWADNVYREGYVTYLNALYYQALVVADKYCPALGYGIEAHRVKCAINNRLWLDEKGWYVNYLSTDYTEDNLSLDTLVCLLYGVADDARAERVLDNCEKWLQSSQNVVQRYGDWGTLCAYPFYLHKRHLVEKSSDEYRYHNGSDWPYLSGLYALVAKKFHRNWKYPAKRWFEYSLQQGWFTPVEYYDPIHGRGSYLQAWSALPALAFLQSGKFCERYKL